MHSHSDKPLLYKITGVWGNHEGSILLWVLMMGGYGAFVPVLGKTLPPPPFLYLGYVGFSLPFSFAVARQLHAVACGYRSAAFHPRARHAP